jgi:hypothetical protein
VSNPNAVPPRVGKDGERIGRKKGTPNKNSKLLKDAILKAAEGAGGKGGLVAYLKKQAMETPGPFLALLGKIIPLQVTGENGDAINMKITRIERVIVDAPAKE